MVIGRIADELTRGVEGITGSINEALFEPVIRLGVTGLARAGKTVFITSLVANMLDRGRMGHLTAAAEGRILASFLQPQPDVTVPRFEYESHLSDLTCAHPHWPDSTRAVSELRLSMRIKPNGLIGGLSGPRTVHLDIVDYPGEWLLDLGLLDQSYAEWSASVLRRLEGRALGAPYVDMARGTDSAAPLDEVVAQTLARTFTAYLHAARADGFSDCTPGRFLLPGDLAGSPVLTFAPLLKPDNAPRRSLWREMETRFEAYKARVVKPFFREHFARIDRQVVLVDVLGALHRGPEAIQDMRDTMQGILGSFRPGRNDFLTQLLRGKRVEKILFAATKADHLHHSQHQRLTAIIEELTREARERARFAGAETAAMSIAALRATTEESRQHNGQTLDVVRGKLLEDGRMAALYPGELPADPRVLLNGEEGGWLEGDFEAMRFAPAPLTLRPGDGPPHIRLDRAAQFLFGDRL
ncbi:YcjX family protein [Donghicola sp.]|uniref:YcjX family protein n=1 Tax=Donghicola sp. TaxID=1929294 RepID=UPI0025F48056|nr:YcjX family protein [Donghicola sp.]MCT4575806.1 YcjX family protein [Donghicola sp.]